MANNGNGDNGLISMCYKMNAHLHDIVELWLPSVYPLALGTFCCPGYALILQ